MADALKPGRLLELDSTGRARPAGQGGHGMIAFVPDDPVRPVLILRQPRSVSAAQKATRELLVEGRQTASYYEA